MKYNDFTDTVVLPAQVTTPARIAKQLVTAVVKDITPEEHAAALEKAIVRFTNQLRYHAQEELKMQSMRKAHPNQ